MNPSTALAAVSLLAVSGVQPVHRPPSALSSDAEARWQATDTAKQYAAEKEARRQKRHERWIAERIALGPQVRRLLAILLFFVSCAAFSGCDDAKAVDWSAAPSWERIPMFGYGALERFRVEGGWLYCRHGKSECGLAFVPDPPQCATSGRIIALPALNDGRSILIEGGPK